MTEIKTVYKAIAAVSGDLAKIGISKDQVNTTQKYKFRGIDDIYNALAQLLCKHNLVILPRYTDRTVQERNARNGGTLFYVSVRGEFDFISTEDNSSHTVVIFGEAMDSGDKATNKAMSAAYKYAAIQTFAIPTEGDNDADTTTHDVLPKGIQHDRSEGGKDKTEKTPLLRSNHNEWIRALVAVHEGRINIVKQYKTISAEIEGKLRAESQKLFSGFPCQKEPEIDVTPKECSACQAIKDGSCDWWF